jgi:hypothetical protein
VIGDHLTHTVAVMRRTEGAEDEYGQPILIEALLATVPAAIQPKTEEEQALLSQAGAEVSDHTVFMLPMDIVGSDFIVHDENDCPLTSDLPDMRLEIDGMRNAAGIGHHLELSVRNVADTQDVTGS